MSFQNQLIRSSGRAIANGAALVGAKTIGSYAGGKSPMADSKSTLIEGGILAATTLVSGTVNTFVASMVKLPAWVLAIEVSYGLDVINLLTYVLAVKVYQMKSGKSESLIKIVLEGVAGLVGGSYLVGPLNNLLPIGMVSK